MVIRKLDENFKLVVSTKKTLFGAISDEFKVYYAPVGDLTNRVEIAGGAIEAIEAIDDTSKHTATTIAPASYGSRLLKVDSQNSTLQEGDVIEYATGKFAYIMKIVGDKVYLKTPIRANVATGDTLTQVGNTGLYETGDISIHQTGEFLVTVEASDYGIVVEQRVQVIDPDAGHTIDTDAPDEAIAVAY